MMQSIAKSWLALQCQMIPGVVRAMVMLDAARAETASPTATWPDDSIETAPLAATGRQAISQRGPVVAPLMQETSSAGVAAGDGHTRQLVACPLIVNGMVQGVVVVEVPQLDEQQQQAVIQLLCWGSAWLEYLIRADSGGSLAARLASVTELTGMTVDQPSFQAAALTALNELARTIDCDRVSLGIRHRNHVRICAMSNSARLDTRTSLIQDLELTMDEAFAEAGSIAYASDEASDTQARMSGDETHRSQPNSSGETKTDLPIDPATQAQNDFNDPHQSVAPLRYAHERHARKHRLAALCSVPFSVDGEVLGVLSFERVKGPAFDSSTLELCDVIAGLVGPILHLKQREDRFVAVKLAESCVRAARSVIGPKHLAKKAFALAIAALLVWLGLTSAPYRVSAEAIVEGSVHRALVAPIDGYVKEALVRAGNRVKKDRLIASLEDRNIKLEQRKLSSERSELINQHRRAVAQLERADASVLQARIRKVEVQLELIADQLARTQIRAPFDGILVSGDLSHSLGAPVARGDVLFELAPLDDYRVTLRVDESEIADVRAGQRGELALAALPGERLSFEVEQVIGIARSDSARNAFEVQARLEGELDRLRPGMEGIGKIEIDSRGRLWIWTHTLLERGRLWLWSRMP